MKCSHNHTQILYEKQLVNYLPIKATTKYRLLSSQKSGKKKDR